MITHICYVTTDTKKPLPIKGCLHWLGSHLQGLLTNCRHSHIPKQTSPEQAHHQMTLPQKNATPSTAHKITSPSNIEAS